MFDCKLYIAVILFILLFFINKHEPFVVSDDIKDNVLLDTNGKTIGENANTNSIKKNNDMVSQINMYEKQNDVVLNSLNECMTGQNIAQKTIEIINKNFNLLTNTNTNTNTNIKSKNTADQSAKITALIELLQRLQTSISRTNDAINKNNYNINSSLRTTFTNFRAGWFNRFDHGTLNADWARGGWGMADNCVRDRMTRTAITETYDKGFKTPGYNTRCFNVGESRNCSWNWRSFRNECSTTPGRNIYNSLYNKYNNNYDLTTYALQKPVSQVNFIRFLEFFIDIKNWNGNPNKIDDSGGYGLQGNATPHKNFSMNSPFGIANIDSNTANVNNLNMKFSDKKITFNMNGEHVIQGI